MQHDPIGNKTRVHQLLFNISSIGRHEEIILAELRLFALVDADRFRYEGIDRMVTVCELTPHLDLERRHKVISSKFIRGRHSGWETFTVTDAFVLWLRDGVSVQALEVRIDTPFDTRDDGDLDFDTTTANQKEPLLVVFSDDSSGVVTKDRDLSELISHETDVLIGTDDSLNDEDYADGDDYYYEDGDDDDDDVYGDDRDDVDMVRVYKRDLTRQLDASNNITKTADTIELKQNFKARVNEEPLAEKSTKKRHANIKETASEKEADRKWRSKRAKARRRRKRRRNMCRRRPMYVNFEDINWHTWIIAPKGYQVGLWSGIILLVSVARVINSTQMFEWSVCGTAYVSQVCTVYSSSASSFQAFSIHFWLKKPLFYVLCLVVPVDIPQAFSYFISLSFSLSSSVSFARIWFPNWHCCAPTTNCPAAHLTSPVHSLSF